jgi:hypothetical protein
MSADIIQLREIFGSRTPFTACSILVITFRRSNKTQNHLDI